MGIFEIIVISIGLAMDAFSVSVCKGLSMIKLNWKNAIKISLYFGVFQGIMPIIGYLFGTRFSGFVEDIDHWMIFILLSIIGIYMIKESFSTEEENINESIDARTMHILAVATSIDALAVGITFAFFDINILLSIIIIGVITFCLSLTGVKIGNKFGDKFQNKSKLTGGIVLIIIGLKILLEHLGIILL